MREKHETKGTRKGANSILDVIYIFTFYISKNTYFIRISRIL